jgi:hypothetical protein
VSVLNSSIQTFRSNHKKIRNESRSSSIDETAPAFQEGKCQKLETVVFFNGAILNHCNFIPYFIYESRIEGGE